MAAPQAMQQPGQLDVVSPAFCVAYPTTFLLKEKVCPPRVPCCATAVVIPLA